MTPHDTTIGRHVFPAVRLAAALAFAWVCMSSAAVAQQPSLDDLLDLAPPAGDTTQPPDDEVSLDSDVARMLTDEKPADVLEQAIVEMDTVSQRLGRDLDAGLITQRQQEEILAKLDRVIAAAKEQQNSGGGGGSSGSSQGQAQGQQSGSAGNVGQGQGGSQGQNQGQGEGEGEGQGQGQNGEGQQAGTQGGGGAGARSGDANQPIEEQRSEWGNLPPRLRDQLLEGTREKFSPVYRDLTEQYYKRLAEEGR
jgi:hypothetical protein